MEHESYNDNECRLDTITRQKDKLCIDSIVHGMNNVDGMGNQELNYWVMYGGYTQKEKEKELQALIQVMT